MLTCPTCLGPLVAMEYLHVELDYCPACRGCWFDDGELALLLRGDPARGHGLPLQPGARGTRACPRCGDRMQVVGLEGTALKLDACPHRHGLWFDGSELAQVINAVSDREDVSRLSDFCDSVLGAAST